VSSWRGEIEAMFRGRKSIVRAGDTMNIPSNPEGDLVEIRYLGFDHRQNSRAYRFEVREQGRPTRQLTVTADMELFRLHRVCIQEGPTLSGNKLTEDLERGWDGGHELTEADVRAHANSQAIAEARRAEQRKTQSQRTEMAEAYKQSPWKNRGI